VHKKTTPLQMLSNPGVTAALLTSFHDESTWQAVAYVIRPSHNCFANASVLTTFDVKEVIGKYNGYLCT
jgi:hypothetical protein